MIDGPLLLDAIGNFVGLLFSGFAVVGSAVASTVSFVGYLITSVFRVMFG